MYLVCIIFRSIPAFPKILILGFATLGVIPRAAGVLFEKLFGLPVLTRNGSSGLRTPTRYSSSSVQTLHSLAKAGAEKGWQMTATYVEVGIYFALSACLSNSPPDIQRAAQRPSGS